MISLRKCLLPSLLLFAGCTGVAGIGGTDDHRPSLPPWTQNGTDAWYKGPLLGNGDLGVVVFGATDEITLALGKNDMWDRRYHQRDLVPISLQKLLALAEHATPETWPEISRQALETPKPDRASPNSQPGGLKPLTPKPVARITLDVPSGSGRASLGTVRHSLSLENAELSSDCRLFRFRTRVQRDRNLVVLRLQLPETGTRIRLFRPADATGTGIAAPVHRLDGETAIVVQRMPADPTFPAGFTCCVAAKVSGTRPPVLTGDGITWTCGEGDFPVLLAAVATTRDSANPESEAKRILEQAEETGGAQLELVHREGWRQYWSKSWIRLDDAPLQQQWYMQNYLLACAARRGAVAPGLFGPWIVPDRIAWHGGYVLDYNFEQEFAACLSCNHCELLWPYFDTIEGMIPAARAFARDLFESTSGVAFPNQIFPIDMTDQATGRTYLCVTPWALQHFWEYYRYTCDSDFLREHAFPRMSECADLLASLVSEDRPGHFIFPFTRSPEHHGFHTGLGYNRNGTPELALARYTFAAALEGARLLGISDARTARWAAVLKGLADYPRSRNQQGEVFVDCEPEPRWQHFVPPVPFVPEARPSTTPGNHGPWMVYNDVTAMFPVFPAEQVDTDSPPETLLTAIRTFETLKAEGTNDFIARHLMAIRLGIPSFDRLKADTAARTMPNGSLTIRMNPLFSDEDQAFIDQYRDEGIYTENFGFPLVLNEMMLQSQRGVLRLFPAIDPYRRAEFHDLVARGGFVVSGEVDRGFVKWAEITATQNSLCRVRLPWPAFAVSLKDAESGEPIEWTNRADDIVFSAKAKATYRLEPIVKYRETGVE